MTTKEIHFSDDARNRLAQGVQKLTDAVKVTMGPSGRNVLIQKQYGVPVLTKDGVSVAQEVFFKDVVENMGAQLVKEVSSNTADEAGDGTTTATVLANEIFQAGLRNVTAGSNPVEMKRGMDKMRDAILENLKDASKMITDKKEIAQVATISANSDSSIGDMIADAMNAVGKDGVITVEQAKGMHDELEVVEGMEIKSGYLSPYFITNTDKMMCELENALVLVTTERLTSLKEILHILEHIKTTKEPLLIIADDVDGEALNTLVVNKMRKVFDVCVVKAPGFNQNKENILDDISVLVGGETISSKKGRKLDSVKVADLGRVEKINISKTATTLVSGAGTEEDIKARVDAIKALLAKSQNEYEEKNYKDRISKLSGGVAIIKVGASTETEMKEKKDRIDDALGATQAAVDEGIIIGGGCAILKAGHKAQDVLNELSGDQRIGAEIVLKGIMGPAKTIIGNTGEDSGLIISQIIGGEENIGYDASNNEFVDMYKGGIIDSLKVSRVALSNAVSVASMLLTTEATINLEEKE